MQYTPPINPRRIPVEALLATRGRTLDWLNSNDDPDSESNIARQMLTAADRTIPLRFRDAVTTEPALRAWTDQLVATARTNQVQRGALVATIATGPSLLLLGRTGVGKTHAAYGAIRDLAISGTICRWTATSAGDLYAALRPRHGIDSETEFTRYRNAPVLLLDDVGAERAPTEFTEEINFRLINHRYERQLPTLITSNVTLPELAGRLGDRVTSRLAEMCQRTVLEGPDKRRGEAA